MTNDSPNLKPCPFCGGAGIVDPHDNDTWCMIKCVDCGATTNSFSTIVDATHYWNTRTPMATDQPVDWSKTGISIDVSTGEDDAWLRAFAEGAPREVMEHKGGVMLLFDGHLNEKAPKREVSGVHGYEISGNTIYIGPMRPDRVKVADITCTIDWDETYTDEAKQRRIRDAERICRGLDRE